MNNIIFYKNWKNYFPIFCTPIFLDFRIEIITATLTIKNYKSAKWN
tara:strand:- start:1597 stop:1734 length:138 start_codon:yes stop_codon:yes gene_type:complete